MFEPVCKLWWRKQCCLSAGGATCRAAEMDMAPGVGHSYRAYRRPGMSEAPVTRFTDRLRLEPVGPGHARDLCVVHNDDEVVPWYDG